MLWRLIRPSAAAKAREFSVAAQLAQKLRFPGKLKRFLPQKKRQFVCNDRIVGEKIISGLFNERARVEK